MKTKFYLSYTINHYDLSILKPYSIETVSLGIAFNGSVLINSRNSIQCLTNAPPNDRTVTNSTESNEFISPSIALMLHVIASQSGLRNRLSFVKFEFLSHEHKIWGTYQTVVEIVASENIIGIERLGLLQRNWEIF